jgi:hypothetical protein
MKGEDLKPSALRAEVARLTALVQELRARVEQLEGASPPADPGNEGAHSRRDLLKLAGAAAVGAADAMVLRGVPAAAATGTPMLNGASNDPG